MCHRPLRDVLPPNSLARSNAAAVADCRSSGTGCQIPVRSIEDVAAAAPEDSAGSLPIQDVWILSRDSSRRSARHADDNRCDSFDVGGIRSSDFASGLLSAGIAEPMQHVPSPNADAASIRFSAASQQSADTNGPIGFAQMTISVLAS